MKIRNWIKIVIIVLVLCIVAVVAWITLFDKSGNEQESQEQEVALRYKSMKWTKNTDDNMKIAIYKDGANIYEDAYSKSKVVKKLGFAKKLNILYESDKWYKVSRVYTVKNAEGQKEKKTIQGFVPKYYTIKFDSSKKHCALTFDDGPSTWTTPIVLDALEKNNAKATFFCLGQSINKDTGKLIKRAHDLGCEIGSHTYDHAYLPNLSKAQIKKQVNKTDKRIKKYIGSKASVMRAPYGAYDKKVLKVFKRPNIFWSMDTEDWKYKDTARLKNYVPGHIHDGEIVLMHDIHETTAKAVNSICKSLKKKNYELVTVTELAAINGQKLNDFKGGNTYFEFYK
ncbi:MAG: polysaccharide deacetylase family protein [Clostridia bacterium]|nr:polysaccharide deacetylase family protein [Clostridia bacterium]